MRLPFSRFLQNHIPIVLFAVLLSLTLAQQRGVQQRLPYPPTSEDQEKMYLPAGKAFAEHFLFFGRAPVYAVWLGTFYLASGKDLQRCFYLEKVASVFLLSLLTAYLGWRLLDARTGLLLGVWTLNCKYFLLESNGSNGLAASLFAGSALCFFLPRREMRLPAALAMFFLAAKTRAEMLVPLGLVLAILSMWAIKRWWREGRVLTRTARLYWLTSLLLCVGLGLLFTLRVFWPEPHQVKEAFAMNFAMNYIDRHQLQERFPETGKAYPEIWAEVFPAVSPSPAAIRQDLSRLNPFAACWYYPKEMAKHVAYNIKLALRALPAMALGLDRPFLMLLILLAYSGSYLWGANRGFDLAKWRQLPTETRRYLTLWAATACSLILVSLVFRVVARYYFQLLPVQLLVLAFVARFILERAATVRVRDRLR